MSCYSCHARLIQSRGMTDSEIPVPLLYDNSIKPTWRNEAVLMATEKRPMYTNKSTERTLLAQPGRQYEQSEQSVGPRDGKFNSYIPTYQNSLGIVHQPPEQSVGPRPGKLSQYVPTFPYSKSNTYNPPGISVSPVSNGYVSIYPTP